MNKKIKIILISISIFLTFFSILLNCNLALNIPKEDDNKDTGDTTKPIVNITNPSDSMTIGGTITITATASDNVSVTKVEFYINNSKVDEVTSSPYEYEWITTEVSDDNYDIKAKAYDAEGNIGIDDDTEVIIDQGSADITSPTVNIVDPSDDDIVAGTITITALASDNKGIQKVDFYIDNIYKGTDSLAPYTYNWDTTEVSDGIHNLMVKAYDTSANSATDNDTSVNVLNYPTLTILNGPWFQNFETGFADQTYDSGINCISNIYDLSEDSDSIGAYDLSSDSNFGITQDPSAFTKDCDHNDRFAFITPKPLNDTGNNIYAVNASEYEYLVVHYYLNEMGYKEGILGAWKAGGDNFFLSIITKNGESQTWTSFLNYYSNNEMKAGEWSKIFIDLDDPNWTGAIIDKSTIKQISICEYDDFTMYFDDIYFADNTYDPVPSY